jgi:hypothetical protein
MNARAHRLPPTHALLRLLQASGIDADATHELRAGLSIAEVSLSPGMLYAVDGILYHLPRRSSPGYIGRLVPGTPEAVAYLALAVPVQLPNLQQPTPGWWKITRLRVALLKIDMRRSKKTT